MHGANLLPLVTQFLKSRPLGRRSNLVHLVAGKGKREPEEKGKGLEVDSNMTFFVILVRQG